ncbi:MAG: DUF11 domain-containing protein [Planctomycetia bacterium]|nr:DUF11 domain-containing protein [Planctomycetia bacterium]
MNPLATPFARRSSRPVRKPARTAFARRPGLDRAEQLERRDLLAILAGGVERTTPDDFFTDFSVGMTSEYTAYTITNDASGPATDVWVKALFPTGSPVGVGSGYNNEDGLYHIGTLAPSTTGTAFLYFTANALSAAAVPYSIEVYGGEPGNGGSLLVTKPFSLTTVVNTLAAEPNKVDTVAYAPANPQIGDTLTLSVTGRLGNGADRVLFAPASATSWEPDVFELRSTSHTISGVAQAPNGLFYDGLTGLVNQQPFTSTYEFLITRPSTTSTLTSPTQFTQDGAQDWKHHKPDATPFPTIPPIPPRLTLTKNDGVTTYTPGGMTTYTIVLANTGAGAASGVVVSDILPPQLNAAATTWTVSYSNASGTLPANGSGNIGGTVDLAPLTGVVTITIKGVILSSAVGDMTNTVTATVSGSTVTASDTNTPTPLANLTITKTDETSTVLAGGGTIQTYTLRVRNDGLSDARTVVVNDAWPAGFQQGTLGTPTQGSVSAGSGGNFAWTLGTLVAGGEATLTVTYTVPASTLPGTYTNTATVTSTTPDTNPVDTASDSTDVITSANLTITKTDLTSTVLAGGGTVQTYTLAVQNSGASNAQNVVVNDVWPAGFTQGAFGLPSQGSVTPAVGGNFVWSVGKVVAGGTATLQVSYTVPASTAPGLYTNTATVTSGTSDPVPGNNTASDTTTVTAAANLTIEKSDATTTVTAGGGTVQLYTLTVRNLGASDAQSVVVNDVWPAGFQQGAFGTPSQGTVASGSGGNFAWTLGTVSAGGVATLQVAYTVPASTLAGTYTNTATVTSTTPDPDPNNTAVDLTDVIASANLTITKTDGVTSVLAGGGTVQTYTLRVRNNGVSDAQAVVVNDTWPAGFTRGAFGIPTQGSVASGPGSNFTWSIGTLAANTEVTLTVSYTVPASTLPGSYTNTAVVTSSTPDPDPANTATDTTTVTTSADLRITKTDSATIVTAGDGITHNYLLTVTNLGASDAQNVAVSDLWPDGFAQTGFGVPSQGMVTPGVGGDFSWSLGVLPAGGVATLVVSYTVPSATLPGPYVNTATVTSSTFDPDPDNTATDTTTVIAMPDLSITKTDGVATVVAGGGTVQTYTITVRNSGVSDARGVVATDDWPAGFTPGTFGTPSQGSVATGVGGDFIWSVGTLPAGGSATLTVTYTVAANVLPGPRTNTATVTSTDDPESHTATDTTTVLTSADLIVAKTDFTTTATAGDGVVRTYLIRVRNGGVSDAQGVVLTDVWPLGFDQTTIGIPSQGTVASGPGSDFTWSIGTLPAGVQVTLQVSYVVPSSTLPGNYVNTATVTSQTPDPFNNNTISDTTTVVTSANLTITKDDGVTTVLAGGGTTQTYTLTVRNLGASDARDVAVSDVWPAGFVQTGLGLPSQGTLTPGTGGDFGWSLGTLAKGGVATLAVTYTVPASTLPGAYTNTATVTSTTPDPVGDNTATDTNTVKALSNLVITKDDGVTTVLAGGGTTQTYTIRVRNTGASDARNVTVADDWPAGFASAGLPTTSQGTVTPGSGGDFSWAVGTIAAAAEATLTVTYTVPAATLPGAYVNTATVTTSTPDSNPTDTATDSTTVTALADVSITKTDLVTSVTAGGGTTQTYTIRVKNNGLGFSDAQDVVVTDIWPDGFTQGAFGLPSQGSVSPGVGGNFTWSLGTLAQDTEAALTVTYTVPASTLPGVFTNTASVTSSTPDPDPNNTATDSTTVVASADLIVAKTDFATTVTAGGGIVHTYLIRVRNGGVSDAQGVLLTDAWPAGFTQGAFGLPSQGTVTPSGSGNFSWSIGTLAAGAQVTLQVSYTVPSTTLPGPYTNTATVKSDTPDPFDNNSASDTTTVVAVADLWVTKRNGDAPYTPGTSLTYTITVGNHGPSTVFGTTVNDPLPEKTTLVSASSGATYDPITRTVTFPVGRLDPGATQVFKLTVITDPDRTGPLENTVTVAVPADVFDPDLSNNIFVDPAGANPVSDLWVTKRNGDAPYTPGTALTYTITVGNFGPSTVFGTTASDPLPTKTTFVSASSGATYDPATRTVTFPVGRLDPGATQVFKLTVITDPDRRGPLINTATVAVPPGWFDPDLDNNFVIDPAADTPLVSLGVTKTDGKTTYVPGTSTTYTIVVTNSGPSTLLGGTVSDPLPALASGGTWTAVATAGSSVTPAGGSGDLNALIDLAPGGKITFTYVVSIKSTASGNLVNTVTVSPPEGTSGGGVSATDVNVSADVPALVLGTDDGCLLAPWVKIINPTTGGLIRQFLAYESTFRGSVRVATGDLTGDGVAEIVVAPGRGRVGEIRVFTQQGVELTRYRTLPFGATWVGGVEVAVGDVNRDGRNDIIAGQATGAGRVNVFQVLAPAAADPVVNVPIRSFRPFVSPYALGVMVAAGDFGTYSGGVKTSSTPDGRSEIVVGTNAGIRAQVRIYDASSVNPVLVKTLLPFASNFTGGVSLSTGRYTADDIDDVMIGTGVGGESRVQVYNGANWNLRQNINAFSSFGRPNAAVFAAMLDLDGDGVATDVYGVQGRNATGGTSGVRRFNRPTSATNVLPQSIVNAPPLRIAAIKLRNA